LFVVGLVFDSVYVCIYNSDKDYSSENVLIKTIKKDTMDNKTMDIFVIGFGLVLIKTPPLTGGNGKKSKS
jgi:hypothetical protein